MTRAQLVFLAMKRVGLTEGEREKAEGIVNFALAEYDARDLTELDGKGFVSVENRETGVPEYREVQLHAPRKIRPFVYLGEHVVWLERELRRGLR